MKITEEQEDLTYVTVTFKTPISTLEKRNDEEIIYDEVKTEDRARDTNPVAPDQPNELQIVYEEVKTEERAWDTHPVTPVGNEKKAPLNQLAAALGIIFVILVSVIIALSIHFNTVMSEQTSLSAQNLQLRTENTALKTQREELTRERDRLNWTIGVILEYKSFPVSKHCPKKVCKPCLDGWVLFQSNCYLFSKCNYSSCWKTWQESHDLCKAMNTDLVVIDSQEEQEFINSRNKKYHNDDMHGYWIGLSRNTMDTWAWVDGSNFTVTYWITQQVGSEGHCGITLPHAGPLANWNKASCGMRNRWICETRTLIKPD